MKILYEDKEVLIYHKPSGIAVQTSRVGEKDMVSECKNYLSGKYVGVVHRLDQPVEGILLFAKSKSAAAALSRQIAEGKMKKEYMAYVFGQPPKSGNLVHYLIKEAGSNFSKISDAKTNGAKRAELNYTLLKKYDYGSVLNIELITGRHHQIRIQMAEEGFPLMGDKKYGSEESMNISQKIGISNIALCACSLSFNQPLTGKMIMVTTVPEGRWNDAE